MDLLCCLFEGHSKRSEFHSSFKDMGYTDDFISRCSEQCFEGRNCTMRLLNTHMELRVLKFLVKEYKDSSTLNDKPVLHQLFVTVSPKLCHAVKQQIVRMKRFICGADSCDNISEVSNDA